MYRISLLLLFCIVLFRAKSQPGRLDSSFGNNGTQTTTFINNLNTVYEQGHVVLTSANNDVFVVVQFGEIDDYTAIAKYLPNGKLDLSYGNAGYSSTVALNAFGAVFYNDKIIVAGAILNGSECALYRYKADGKLDSSFGVNGKATTIFRGYSLRATSIALQGDKIIVSGEHFNSTTGNDFALARYTADGKLDSSFGVNGLVTTNFQKKQEDYINATVLQGDKIVVAGYTTNRHFMHADFALARYTANGILDSSFGVNGLVTTDFNNSEDVATSIALQGDKIVVGGYTDDRYHHRNFALARYMADGVIDSTFGVNGKATTNLNNPADVYIYDIVVNSIALQEDKIILGGYTSIYNIGDIDFALTCFTADGTLDSSFGKNGLVTTDFNNSNDKANSIALQGDKIILAGGSGGDFALARYTPDGKLDASFGMNGLLTGYIPTENTSFTSIVMQGDKIIAAGYTDIAGFELPSDFALTRYTADGAVDTSFGVKGIVTTRFHEGGGINAIALQGNKIIAAGYTGGVDEKNFAFTRYTADGTLDSTFGVNGKIITDFYHADNSAKAIAIQGDKILVAGSNADFDKYPDLALARYMANGKLDSTFGKNGKVIDTLNVYGEGASSIMLQGDKIVVAGSALARYTKDGKLDSSFGVNGKVKAKISGVDFATSAVLQGNKIIMVGYHEHYNNQEYNIRDFSLSRYSANGVLDTTFGVNGKVTDFNDYYITSLALQGDKIIVGGFTGNNSFYASNDLVLARYTADGKLDSSFGENGREVTHLEGNARLQAIALHENRLYAVGRRNGADLTGISTQGIIAAYQLETPEPLISIADATVAESKRLAIVTVRLSAPANKIVRAHFTTRNKTAVSNQDYISINGPLLFIPGVNNMAKIFIPLINDEETEGTEQFEIVLSNARNATIQDSIGVVAIIDDDALITKQSTSLHIQASPNPFTSSFTIQLQGSNLKQPVGVQVYDVSGRLLEQRNNISIGQRLRLGDRYKAGTYIIQAVQGSRCVQTKVIKTQN